MDALDDDDPVVEARLEVGVRDIAREIIERALDEESLRIVLTNLLRLIVDVLSATSAGRGRLMRVVMTNMNSVTDFIVNIMTHRFDEEVDMLDLAPLQEYVRNQSVRKRKVASLSTLAMRSVADNADYFMKLENPFAALPTVIIQMLKDFLPDKFSRLPYVRLLVTGTTPFLDIEICRKFGHSTLPWTERDVRALCRRISTECKDTLKSLSINVGFISPNKKNPTITCAQIAELVKHLPKLQVLKVKGDGLKDIDAIVTSVAKYCPDLIHLDIQHSCVSSASRQGFRALCLGCKNLRNIHYFVSDIEPQDVVFALQKLKNLTTMQCVTRVDFYSEGLAMPEFTKTYLGDEPLNFVSPVSFNKNVSRKIVNKMLTIFPRAERALTISGKVTRFSSFADLEGFEKIMIKCDGYSLGKSKHIETMIMNNAQNLTELDIYGGFDISERNFTDKVSVNLSLICKHCPNLYLLQLSTALHHDESIVITDRDVRGLTMMRLHPPDDTTWDIPDDLLYQILSKGLDIVELRNIPISDALVDRLIHEERRGRLVLSTITDLVLTNVSFRSIFAIAPHTSDNLEIELPNYSRDELRFLNFMFKVFLPTCTIRF